MVLLIVLAAVVSLASLVAIHLAYLHMEDRRLHQEAASYHAAQRIQEIEYQTVRQMVSVAADYQLRAQED